MAAETEMTAVSTPAEGADVGASLPSPEEVITDVNPRRAKSNEICTAEGSNALICFFLAMILVLSLSLGLGIGLADRDEKEEYRRKSTPESIQEYAIIRGLSSSFDFQDQNSPQSQAASWMAWIDEMNMPTPSPSISSDDRTVYQFAIRYAMAVVYFSTGGDNWYFDLNFLSMKETCTWNGLLQNSEGGYLSYGLICNQRKEPLLLYLDNNRLSQKIPNEIAAVTTLTVLDFKGNDELSGTIPDGICQLTELRSLAISVTSVRGNIPNCINKLENIVFLTFSNSRLSGPLPSLNGMDNLQTLLLDDNSITGDISHAFDNNQKLKFLSLDNNGFTGNLNTTFMAGNTDLVQLDLSGNYLAGELPVHLFTNENLRLLDLHRNYLGGEMPEFPVSTGIRFLALHNNFFSGPVRASIQNLLYLEHLDLSSNALSGNMTEEIGSLKNLTYLFLANNTFEAGPIPASFANLDKLEEFSVKSTSRTGPIPEFISSWSDLKLLDLDGNFFDGKIPTTFGTLGKLEFLLLNNNSIVGQVPTELQNLNNIRAMFLEDNDMFGNINFLCETGKFNETRGDVNGDEILVADCGEPGNIECSCCNVCCVPVGKAGRNILCDDHDLISSLDPIWETSYSRAYYDFGNFTRFVDKDWLP